MIKKNGNFKSYEEWFLAKQNVSSLDEVNEWAKKSHAAGFYVDGLDDAVILASKFKNKPVTIVGDYDADGITSTLIFVQLLRECGFTNVSYRIPKRFSEGYGISEKIIDEISDGLIITCDNGIAGLDAIRKAKEKGLTVIVTDHHLPVVNDNNGEVVLPDADIIIDPNAIPDSADFNGYCGAGLAYKFCERMLSNDRTKLAKYQVLAAIGTICDVMELTSENYIIVREGLKKMLYPYNCTTGLYALICQYELSRHCTAHDVGFKLGPAINSMSRLNDDGAATVVKALLYNGGEMSVAVRNAQMISETNELRKQLSKSGFKLAEEYICDNMLFGNVPMVIYLPNIAEGIIGNIAGKVSEKYNAPAIVFTDGMEPGILKGSARSPEGYHLKNNLDKVSDRLYKYGGHEGAAGLSVKTNMLETFTDAIMMKSDSFTPSESNTDTSYDFEISAKDVPQALEELKKFEPFGKGNESPTFLVKDVKMLPSTTGWVRYMGDGSIAKITCKGFEAITFDKADSLRANADCHDLNIVGTLSENYFNNKCTAQIEFSDIEYLRDEKPKTALASALKQRSEERYS